MITITAYKIEYGPNYKPKYTYMGGCWVLKATVDRFLDTYTIEETLYCGWLNCIDTLCGHKLVLECNIKGEQNAIY